MNLIMEKRNIKIMKEYNPFFYNLMRAGIIDKMTGIKAEKFVILENIPYVMAKKINLITDMEIIKMINADGGETPGFFFVKRGDDKTLNNLYTPETIHVEIASQKQEVSIQTKESKTVEEPSPVFVAEDNEEISEEKVEEPNVVDIQDFISSTIEESEENLSESAPIEEIKEELVVEESSSEEHKISNEPIMTSGYIQVVREEDTSEIESETITTDLEDSEPIEISINQDVNNVEKQAVESTTTTASTINEPIKITAPTNFKGYNGKNKKKKKH